MASVGGTLQGTQVFVVLSRQSRGQGLGPCSPTVVSQRSLCLATVPFTG